MFCLNFAIHYIVSSYRRKESQARQQILPALRHPVATFFD
jgi:hypothetical protein